MELELKLLVRPADAARLAAHALLQDYAGAPVRQRLVTVYLDTPELSLWQRGFALRLRRSSAGWQQSLKGGGTVEGGAHRREEWETPVTRGAPDLAALLAALPTDHGARRWLQRAVRDGNLHPVFRTEFVRTAWRVECSDGSVVECALDRGRIVAGEAFEPLCEIELELKAGDPAVLFELAAALLDDLPFRLGVESKAERGFSRARGRPCALPAAVLDAPMAVVEAHRALVSRALQQWLIDTERLAAAGEASRGECIHYLRVALRRLRAVLTLFPAPYACPEPLLADIRALREGLAGARDWDVLLAETLPTIPSLQPGVGAGLARLRETVAAIDGVRDQAAVVEAASVRTTRIALALGQWLCAAPPAPSDGDAAAIGELWPLLLARQKKQIGKRLRQTRADDPATFHALRIAVRKTRYAIEFFAPLQAGKVVARRLAALVKLQDVLGRINDQAIGAELVRQAAVTRPDDPQLAAESAFAAGFLTAGARAGAGKVAKLARRALRTL